MDIPYASLNTPEELKAWIEDQGDTAYDQAWADHDSGKAGDKKWLVAAIDPDQRCYTPPTSLQEGTFELNEDVEWVDGKDPADGVLEWVQSAFIDHTGLQPYINEDLDLDIDEDGRIDSVSGIAIHGDNGTTWLANFEWGNEDEWLIFTMDEH